jgi:hypothetical protein
MPNGSRISYLVPLDTLLAGHGLLLALAGAGVAPRALAANGQASPVAVAPVAADVLEALNVLLDLPPQRPLDDVARLAASTPASARMASADLGPMP